MNDVDTLLERAGDAWRAAQPAPPAVDVRRLAAPGQRWSPLASFAVGTLGVVALLVIGVTAAGLGLGRSVGGPPSTMPTTPSSSPSMSPSAGRACEVTRPIPPFVAPSPYPASPPPEYGSEWFGSRALWAMLDRNGEVWTQSALPQGPGGLTQKTFWWSADRIPQDDLVPAITVTGTRLDGPGTFEFGPGTNASADFGPAMLVGIEIPSAGCWQFTARYRDAGLSYVVLITED